jgi:hypothetical protein
MSVRIVRARIEHAPAIAQNLSEIGVTEIENLGRAEEEIADEIEASLYSQVGLYKGKVACIWGVRVVNLLESTGFIWAVTTKIVEEQPFLFARHSKITIDGLMAEFKILHGIVQPRHKRSIRWLKFLGFEILPKREMLGREYYPFIRRA